MFGDAYLFGQIVIDDESMPAIVPEILSHSTCRVGGQVLQRSRIRGCRRHDDRVFHSTYTMISTTYVIQL